MRPLLLSTTLALLTVSGCASLAERHDASRQAIAPQAALTLPPAFTRTTAKPPMSLANDPVLDALLAQVSASPNVAIAQSRLIEARARLDAARAGLLPSLSATASFSGGSSDQASGTALTSIGPSLFIPIDVFGANQSRAQSARARAEEAAFIKDRTAAQTRATLYELYVALRAAQAQIGVTQANQISATDSLSLAFARQRAGLETGLAVAQATSNRDAVAARLPNFQQAEVAARLGIEALLGKMPDTELIRLKDVKPIPRFDLSRVDVAPDQWLVTRADLAAAQRRLQAAGLEARAARRDRLPTLSLTALATQTDARRGPDGLSGTGSVNLLVTLFDFGRLDALARASGAIAVTEANLYRQVVVNAVADVETQVSRVDLGQAAIVANDANVASAQDQARLARVRYTSGLSGFLDVLTAERAVFEAQSAAVEATRASALAEIALGLALGF